MAEDFYLSVLAGMSVGVLVCDAGGSPLYSNDRAKELLGFGKDTVLDRDMVSFGWIVAKQGMITGESRTDILSVSEENRKVVIQTAPLTSERGMTGVVSILYSAEQFAEEMVGQAVSCKKVASDLEAIIENAYDGLYITDGQARTIMINKAYERITGMKRTEILGKNMKELVDSGIIDRSVSLEVLENRGPVTIMQELRGGKKILVTGSPIFDKESREIVLVVTNVRDITELVELRDKLHERTLEANRYLAELDKIKALQQQKAKFVTKSRRMAELLDITTRAAQFDSNILITGESGVGKGLLATLIHEASGRRDHPFVVINCAGIPEDLFESELLGYEPGAFSGASAKGKKGLLEVADKGSVFLDEIGDMSLRLQSKLLRVIEEKEMTRLGSTKTIKLNVRIIAATNQDIPNLTLEKKFRQDLFFRINTISLVIPPLRERTEDIIPLMQHFTERLNGRYPMAREWSPAAAQTLMLYPFPGNVRELSNIVEQAFLMSKGNMVEVDDLPFQVRSMAVSDTVSLDGENKSYDEIVNLMEYKILKNALQKYGSTHKVAKELGMSQSTVVRKIKKLNINRTDT